MKTEGYVYVSTNKGMRGLVKIGRITGSVEQRAQSLSSKGVPFPFEIAFKMNVTDCVACEKFYGLRRYSKLSKSMTVDCPGFHAVTLIPTLPPVNVKSLYSPTSFELI